MKKKMVLLIRWGYSDEERGIKLLERYVNILDIRKPLRAPNISSTATALRGIAQI